MEEGYSVASADANKEHEIDIHSLEWSEEKGANEWTQEWHQI